MTQNVHWKLNDKVAEIHLANPPLNLLDVPTLEDFGVAVRESVESEARAILLVADGPVFSGGADVSIFRGVTAAQAWTQFRRWLPNIQALEEAPIPTVAAVQGLCLAGGLELALACDVIIAAEGTKLGQTEATIGTTTLLGGAQRIAQRAGIARARSICYGAAVHDATDFERWGILDQVVPADSLLETASALAVKYAEGPTQAHAAVKAMVRVGATSGVRAADAFLLDHALELFDTEDMQTGVAALLEHGARNFGAHTTYVGR